MALNISRNIVASEKGRELVQHGSALFPIACYAEDLSSYSVAWHWHEEFEYVLCTNTLSKIAIAELGDSDDVTVGQHEITNFFSCCYRF